MHMCAPASCVSGILWYTALECLPPFRLAIKVKLYTCAVYTQNNGMTAELATSRHVKSTRRTVGVPLALHTRTPGRPRLYLTSSKSYHMS
eukprot:scaffold12443_cov108-Isochrysis_galbana.AAC.3